MFHLINFADDKFKAAQKFNSKTAKKFKIFDTITEYKPENIDNAFKTKNKHIFIFERGFGLFLWKPYFILKRLNEIYNGDILMYCDAGAHFINTPKYLLELFTNSKQDIIPFELELFEKEWTKRDAFYYMSCDMETYYNTCQRLATFVLLKKNAFSIKFVKEWLSYSSDKRIISDDDNQCGKKNDHSFKAHRHDQSIFSLLSKKYKLDGFRDPSQFGNPRIKKYHNSPYPQIIESTRQKIPKQSKLSYKIKKLLGIYFLRKIIK